MKSEQYVFSQQKDSEKKTQPETGSEMAQR